MQEQEHEAMLVEPPIPWREMDILALGLTPEDAAGFTDVELEWMADLATESDPNFVGC